MKRTRKSRGITIVQTTISAALLLVILGAAATMVSASSALSQSTNNVGNASNRADRTLEALVDAMRRGSIASVLQPNGTYFSEGTTSDGFAVRAVTAYTGGRVVGPSVLYRFVIATGATEGQVIRTENGVQRVVANGVTAFSVSRTGNLFTFDIRTRSGPTDDRARRIHATVQTTPRNP
jgi:hypothetical protein